MPAVRLGAWKIGKGAHGRARRRAVLEMVGGAAALNPAHAEHDSRSMQAEDLSPPLPIGVEDVMRFIASNGFLVGCGIAVLLCGTLLAVTDGSRVVPGIELTVGGIALVGLLVGLFSGMVSDLNRNHHAE